VAAAWSRLDPELLIEPSAAAGASAARVALVAALLLLVATGAWLVRRRLPAAQAAPAEVDTWGCGYARPTARMQYTGSSFAALLVSRFSWAIFARPRRAAPEGPFPRHASFATEVPDTVLDVALPPAVHAYGWLATSARLLYLRRIQFQILLVLATLVAVLAWGFAW
jgi:hypothetical protein